MKVFSDRKRPNTLLFIDELTMRYTWGVGGSMWRLGKGGFIRVIE